MQNVNVAGRIRDSRRAGRELATAFRRGIQPQQVPAFQMPAGEYCVGQAPVLLLQYMTAEVEYVKKGGGYAIGGSPAGMVFGAAYSLARLATNKVGNEMRKSRAEREAAGQWRPVDEGMLYLTNRRFAIHGNIQWTDLWFEQIRMSNCDGLHIELEVSGFPSTSLDLPGADYWFVMFNRLAYNNILTPPDPDAALSGPP